MIRDSSQLLTHLRQIHETIRDRVVAACQSTAMESLAAEVGSEGGDTIFAIDRVSEQALLELFEPFARRWPCLLVAEGLGQTGVAWLPQGSPEGQAEVAVLVDPIDGTGGLMYQKRPAWVLTGVAPYHGSLPTLADIELAVQTEIPVLKQYLSDCLWAQRLPQGDLAAGGERFNRLTGERSRLAAHPSQAKTIAQGFGSIARFFPGQRGLLAQIDDELVERVLGRLPYGRAASFEDQYISSAGQLYELAMGHDRWTADLRPLAWAMGSTKGLCSHPYDLCTELVARAWGIVTGLDMRPLDAPFDVETDVVFAAFANQGLSDLLMPVLRELVQKYLGMNLQKDQ